MLNLCLYAKKHFLPRNITFLQKSLQVSGFLRTFALGYKTMVVHPSGRTSDAQLSQPGIFYAIRVVTRNIPLRLPSRKIKLALRVEPSSCNQRGVQPFLCLCASAVRWHGYKTMHYATDSSTRAGSALRALRTPGAGKEHREFT